MARATRSRRRRLVQRLFHPVGVLPSLGPTAAGVVELRVQRYRCKTNGGTLVGIARRPAKFYIEPRGRSHPETPGVHGGMTRAEMLIPLVLA